MSEGSWQMLLQHCHDRLTALERELAKQKQVARYWESRCAGLTEATALLVLKDYGDPDLWQIQATEENGRTVKMSLYGPFTTVEPWNQGEDRFFSAYAPDGAVKQFVVRGPGGKE